MATMHRLACVGVGNNDITFSDLRSAVTGSLPLLQTAARASSAGNEVPPRLQSRVSLQRRRGPCR